MFSNNRALYAICGVVCVAMVVVGVTVITSTEDASVRLITFITSFVPQLVLLAYTTAQVRDTKLAVDSVSETAKAVEHQTNGALKAQFAEVKDAMAGVHKRLDDANIPPVPEPAPVVKPKRVRKAKVVRKSVN